MIEKKIFSDFPVNDDQQPSNDGLSKNFTHLKQEDLPKKEDSLPVEDEKKDLVPEPATKETPVNRVELPSEPNLKIAAAMMEIFGKDVFERLRKDGTFMVPFTNEQTTLEDWIANSIRMLFNPKETEMMAGNFDRWLEKQQKVFGMIEQENEELKKKLDGKDSAYKQLEADYQQVDAERKTLKRDLFTSISAVYFLDVFLPKGKSVVSDKINQMLKEEMSRPTEDYPAFVTGFTEGWVKFEEVFNKAEDNEPGMEEVHLSLTGLLDKIRGRSIMQRRPILELIAALCTSKFKLYKFISPEESLQVDPRIHSATALGGSTIKEGISFAVIRKDTLQTMKYAEITV